MERVLVTGCWGFVGRALVAGMVEEGYEVWGLDRRGSGEEFPGKGYIPCDLSEGRSIAGVLEEVGPRYVVHLAAQASAGLSFQDPLTTIRTNVLPALHLLEYMRLRKTALRLLAVGSADECGPVPRQDLPLRETQPPAPANPYALSKAVQSQCCLLFHRLYGIDVIVTRSFNHTGPGQKEVFALPAFAKQIIEIKRGLRPPVIMVGNLEVSRDFLDIEDVVRAYLLLLDRGRAGEVYNVCSGRSHSLRFLLDKMIELAGLKVEVKVDREKLRPVDANEIVGDRTKIEKETGWRPEVPIERTLSKLLTYWESRVGEGPRGGNGE